MYFIPGNQNKGNKPKSNKRSNKRLFQIGAAVFVFIVLLISGLKWYEKITGTRGKIHHYSTVPAIDPSFLNNSKFGLPQIRKGDEIVYHYAYTLCYSEKDEEPAWVSYTLKREYLPGTIKRYNHFESDPEVLTGSAAPEDYRNSGYDKGHLAPAADMKWDKQAMQESFLLSNVCPQDHKFNEGIWADLEKAVRNWAKNDGVEYIVTGPLLDETDPLKIGIDHVTVPSYFYKVVFSPDPYPKAVGFIIPNTPGKQSFWHYACTVSEVEKRTNLKFFPMIPEKAAEVIKNNFNIPDWRSSDQF